MKEIPLSRGQVALVDDEDYEWLMQWKWYAAWERRTNTFYAVRRGSPASGKRRLVSMAREILGLREGDRREADHIHHKTLDNRRDQLRIVTRQQNVWNQNHAKGYAWEPKKHRYRASITVNGRLRRLGRFRTPEEAHEAYMKAKALLHSF